MPKPKKALAKLSRQEIEAELLKLSNERDAILAAQHELVAELNARDAAETVAQMSPGQRAQMAQAIKTAGIESTEAVGEPGAE